MVQELRGTKCQRCSCDNRRGRGPHGSWRPIGLPAAAGGTGLVKRSTSPTHAARSLQDRHIARALKVGHHQDPSGENQRCCEPAPRPPAHASGLRRRHTAIWVSQSASKARLPISKAMASGTGCGAECARPRDGRVLELCRRPRGPARAARSHSAMIGFEVVQGANIARAVDVEAESVLVFARPGI